MSATFEVVRGLYTTAQAGDGAAIAALPHPAFRARTPRASPRSGTCQNLGLMPLPPTSPPLTQQPRHPSPHTGMTQNEWEYKTMLPAHAGMTPPLNVAVDLGDRLRTRSSKKPDYLNH